MARSVLLLITAAFLLAAGSNAMAKQISQSPRQSCCLEMGGQYRAARAGYGGAFYCYGLGRGRSDAYYMCVQKKMSGK
jgi:hypothetical protein